MKLCKMCAECGNVIFQLGLGGVVYYRTRLLYCTELPQHRQRSTTVLAPALIPGLENFECTMRHGDVPSPN